MFSNSNSFMGGANSGRPGQQQPQYGQSQYAQQQQQPFGQQSFQGQQQQQQQPSPFAPQQTGFGVGQLQPQYTGMPPIQSQATGFPGNQQQQYPPQQIPQYTGYQSQNNSSFQPQAPPQQQPFQTGQPQNQAPAQLQPTKTGMTSSQIADSFRSSGSPAPAQQTSVPKRSAKIPNMRLSFITAQDQTKFEELFKSATGKDQALSGDKARDLLLRSRLPGDALSQIWMLSDTSKSGQLLFPEFALAMYLCNLKLTGKDLPNALPERVKNEVSSMVDIISFSVPDERPQQVQPTNAPNFNEPPKIQQPQPTQASNSQLLSQLTAQPTGFQMPQQTSFQPQPTGFQPQATGYQNPQPTGYSGLRPPMPPMPTGFGQPQGLSPQQTGFAAPLNAQPTGRPGQWGLVNAPASGLPNLQALQQQMMPQAGRESGFTTQGLRGNATVPWAVTKDEKKIYDDMFKSWDGFGKGFIGGSQAIEIFGQSGLDKSDLERIWTLSDPHNKGRLNLDEFAVAMHLIYRRLNGYPVPNQLPPELIPPSTRNITDSIGTMKSMLSQDAQQRKSSGAFLQPQKTGVSYLKTHSFRGNGEAQSQRKDATVFKNNDDDVGYKSSARRRVGDNGRSPSPALSATASEKSADEMSVDQLQKTIREKQVLLDAMDFQDENGADEEDALDRKDKRESEELFKRVRRLQEDIDSHPNGGFRSSDSDAERRNLQRQLRGLSDRLPELASHVRKCERAISEAQLELFRLKDAKANPSSGPAIVGTGPGGEITESDRLKARARAMMQQRSAALSGKPVPASSDDGSGAAKRLEEETKRVRREREDNERMVHDVEESVSEFSKTIDEGLKEGQENASSEHERRRWEDGLGVEDEVKDFIYELQRSSRSAKIRRDDTDRPSARAAAPKADDSSVASSNSRYESPARTETPRSTLSPSTTGTSYSSYKTAEDRAAFIKQQAEARMAERLAALGLRAPSKPGETAQQKQERERKEREDKVRQAEEEDARREQERQQRLVDEGLVPPPAAGSAKKPAPPAPRKRGGSLQQQGAQQENAEEKRAEHQIAEQALKDQQQAQTAETRDLEDEEARQERELEQERTAAAERMRALEEQVRQGKLKKEEEKKRKREAQKDAKDREANLAAQRAEIEAAKERERQLRLQLENMGDDDSSSDDEDQGKMTPQDSTPTTSQELSREAPNQSATSPPTAPAAPAPPTVTSPPEAGSKNPFFKNMGQPAAPSPGISPAAGGDSQASTNPFYKMTSNEQQPAKTSLPEPTAAPARTRTMPKDDDDWSVVDSSSSSSDDEDQERSGGGSAKHLASILFGTMAPPRPLSSMDSAPSGSGPGSPAGVRSPTAPPPGDAPPAPPAPPPMPGTFAPPPPPMPNAGAPAPPPMPSGGAPPPPPMPSGGAPPAPQPPAMPPASSGAKPAGISGLLGEIQAGKGLKKTQTKDRSTSSTAGRVLS